MGGLWSRGGRTFKAGRQAGRQRGRHEGENFLQAARKLDEKDKIKYLAKSWESVEREREKEREEEREIEEGAGCDPCPT